MIDLQDTKVRLCKSIDDLPLISAWLDEPREWLAIDTETGGLEWWLQPLRLVQFGDEDSAWVMPWELWAGAVTEFYRRTLERRQKIAFHNAKFDLHFLERFTGIAPQWDLVHDTQMMVSLVDGGRPSALKLAAARHVDPRAQAGERLLKDAMADAGWGWDTVPLFFQPYWGYAGLDTVLTARLAIALWPQVQSSYSKLYEMERAAASVIYGMETRGVRIDPVYTQQKKDALSAEVSELSSWGKANHNVALGSPQQLIIALQAAGAVLTKKTDKGKLSTDAVVLTLLGLDDTPLGELARKALRTRKARRLVSAYLNNFMEMKDTNDRLHPSIRQLGARTGRMSVATPALQQLTRGPEIRNCFIASEGHQLVLADYDQIEMRLLYHYCRDPLLKDAIMSCDLHTTTARLVYNDPTITPDDWRRQPAKSSGFAKVYGAGVETFSATAGISVEDGAEFMRLYSLAFPGVDPWIGQVQAVGRTRLRDSGEAWVKTAGGRRQVADPDVIYALTNYLIQGTAADVLKERMVLLDLAGVGDYMVLPVHDEIVFDVPTADVEDVKRIVAEVMPVEASQFGVPLTVSIGSFARWGSKYSKANVDDPLEIDTETGEAS